MTKYRVEINDNTCKGCGLCITVCPKKVLEIDKTKVNKKGYNVVSCYKQDECIGCSNCAMICPDVVLSIYKND